MAVPRKSKAWTTTKKNYGPTKSKDEDESGEKYRSGINDYNSGKDFDQTKSLHWRDGWLDARCIANGLMKP